MRVFTRKNVLVFITTLIFLVTAMYPIKSYAFVPPNGSPLAKKVHPRIILIPENHTGFGIKVSEMRNKLKDHYRTEFQSFIDMMDRDDVYAVDTASKNRFDLTNDAWSYAFLYIIDPEIMSKSPYNFTFAHSKNDYGAKARDYAFQIATNAINNPEVGSHNTWNDSLPINDGFINIPMAAVYDWVNPMLSLKDKQKIADGIIATYNNLLANLKQTSTWPHSYLNSPITGRHNNGLAALAVFGDNIDNSGSTYYKEKIQEILDHLMGDVWPKKIYDWANYIFDNSAFYHGGIYGYNTGTFFGMSTPTYAISTALNHNYYKSVGYLSEHVPFLLYNIKPFPYNGVYSWAHFSDDNPTEAVYNGQRMMEYFYYVNVLSDTNPKYASVAKWIREESDFFKDGRMKPTGSNIRFYYLNYLFIYGDNNVVAKSPSALNLPLSMKFGRKEYVMRTGLENNNDTFIVFWAPKYFHAYGHIHLDQASFMIEKYGNLAIQRSHSKHTPKNIGATKNSMFYNTIGVHKPGENTTRDAIYNNNYNLMCYRQGYDWNSNYKTDSAYQEGGSNHIGTVLAEDLNGKDYDYINYDYSRSWYNKQTTSDSSMHKVDLAQREFVYLRSQGGSNDEYVVIFDRINSLDPSYTKYWLLHASFEPRLCDNSNNTINMTAKNYPNDADGIGGGRWVNKTSSTTQNNIIEITNSYNGSHGRLYNKTLLPLQFQINKVGGSGHYLEDAEGKLILTRELTDEEKNVRGTYTMQIQSNTGQKYDNFLNVMQFGDSNTLTKMTPVSRIDADTMVGVIINDTKTPRIVLFSKNTTGELVNFVKYNVNYNSSLTGKHLIVDLEPGVYNVFKGTNKEEQIIANYTVSAEKKTLLFKATGGSTFHVIKKGATIISSDNEKPDAPTGVRIIE